MTVPVTTRPLFRWVVMLVAVLVAAGTLVAVQPPGAARAASFEPGNIISDQNFYDANAMSQAQIQSFLEAQVPSCGNGNCLRGKRTDTTSRPADAMCGVYQGAASELTSSIIYKVQQACSISAKVLLVTLQKEQTLITATAPSDARIDRAMGYACPDDVSRPGYCDPAYAGLYNQIYRAAWQLKRYGNPAGTSNYFTWYPVGQVAQVRYNPNAACGSSGVYISNKATAALYYYTPYQPNAAALANMTGTGDSCSAYGNRNFWRFYTSWFGATTGPTSPFGNVESVTTGVGSLRVTGWTIDPDDMRAALAVHVYIDGVGAGAVTANASRPDVGAIHTAAGAGHGFDASFGIAGGRHEVCVFFINVGGGGNTSSCSTVTVPTGNPFGYLDSAVVSGNAVTVKGWSIDPDTRAPIDVHLYANGQATVVRADEERPDVGRAYSAYGSAHGYEQELTLAAGSWNICAFGINAGGGDANTVLGCQTVVVTGTPTDQGRTPRGNFEELTATAGTVALKGWALDPDTTAPVSLTVTVGGTKSTVVADAVRADVGSAFPGSGDRHGFQASLAAPSGSQQVCVTAANDGRGGDVSLGCRTVTVPSSVPVDRGRTPFGNFESAAASGGAVTVTGWAIDPDTAKPLQVHVYVGSAATAIVADVSRPDVAAAYPASGDRHGFSATLPAGTGSQNVCAFAINDGAGANTVLGCKTVTVTSTAPVGNVESVSGAAGSVSATGWMVSPGSPDAVPVHVYVDGVGTPFTADLDRPDVGAAYPALGSRHGFSATVPVAAGAHTVCVWGLDVRGGQHRQFGCWRVTSS